jgi:multimeric flavodoxin WrbA
MRATIINCTLKPSPERSSTEALAQVVGEALEAEGVETELIRALDHELKPGVETDMGSGDEWPQIHAKLLASEIVVIATPTWLGQPSSVAKRVLERMDAMIAETDDDERPVAYNRVGGVVVTGNEDGAHNVISDVAGALIDIGYTVPGQAWTYWNKGPGPGESYLDADDDEGKEWSHTTGRAAAQNLVAVARALEGGAMQAPPS